jgi:hypothetical protein
LHDSKSLQEAESVIDPKDNVPPASSWPIIQLELEAHEAANDMLQLYKPSANKQKKMQPVKEEVRCC